MKNSTPRNPHRYLVLSLFFLVFTIAMTMLLVFIERKMENLDSTGFLGSALFLPLLLLLPIPLIITILYQLANLIKERLLQKAGSHIRIHLTLFFIVITFISAAPQAFLSVNLVRIMLNAWYSSGPNVALNRSLELATTYYDEHVKLLEAIANNNETYRGWPLSTEDQTIFFKNHPSISSVQLFNQKITLFYGNQNLKITQAIIPSLPQGLLSLSSINRNDFLYYKVHRVINGLESAIIMTAPLADGFIQTADILMQQEESARLYSRFAFSLKSGLAFFYLLFSLPLALLAILAGFLFSNELVQPIIKLEKATQRVTNGDYTVRLKHVSGNELTALMKAFNTMMDELELSRIQGAKIEKMAAWGEIAQRMAHEIKNPLTPIRLSAQRIQKKSRTGNLDAALVDHAMQIIINESDALTAMVDQFSALAYSRKVDITKHSLLEVIIMATNLYTEAYPLVQFTISINPQTVIPMDQKMIHQLLINIFKNSIEAMNGEGKISISSQSISHLTQAFEELTITDSGYGFNDSDLDHIFTPYFSRKSSGSGLGLAVVQKIIFEHNGRIMAKNSSTGGATFVITLPNL